MKTTTIANSNALSDYLYTAFAQAIVAEAADDYVEACTILTDNAEFPLPQRTVKAALREKKACIEFFYSEMYQIYTGYNGMDPETLLDALNARVASGSDRHLFVDYTWND